MDSTYAGLKVAQGNALGLSFDMKGRERNQSCWCGSGRKLKACHASAATDLSNRSDLLGVARRTQNPSTCVAGAHGFGDCSGRIVKAHTVQEASLRAMAEDGKVMGFRADPATFGTKGVRLEIVGVRDASTFTGFCAKHDDEIFACIEKEAFAFRRDQVAALHFRVLARELYKKETLSGVNLLVERAAPRVQRQRQKVHQAGTNAGLRDSKLWAAHGATAILRGSAATDLHWLAVEMVGQSPIMCAGGYFPDVDLQGRALQDLLDLDRVASILTISLFSSSSRSFGVLAWPSDCSEALAPLVEQLRGNPLESVVSTVATLAIQRFENVFFAPSWLSALSDDALRWIKICPYYGTSPFFPVLAPPPPTPLPLPVARVVRSSFDM